MHLKIPVSSILYLSFKYSKECICQFFYDIKMSKGEETEQIYS